VFVSLVGAVASFYVLTDAIAITHEIINTALSYGPVFSADYEMAGNQTTHSWVNWYRPQEIEIPNENPFRQYCFNCFRWKQANLNPDTYYGINISARLTLKAPNPIGAYVYLPPVSLQIYRNVKTLQIYVNGVGTTDPPVGTYTYDYGTRVTVTAYPGSSYVFLYWNLDTSTDYSNPIAVDMYSNHQLRAFFLPQGGWGGGCPTLLVWNGSGYNDFGVINIHNPDGDYDVVKEVSVLSESVGITNYVAKIRLREGWEGLNYSHSAFDQVKLYAVVGGTRYLCPLFYANHSTLGNVLLPLMFSDDWKVDAYLMETVDLKFLVPYQNVQEYVFVIEGINHLKR
jgi:hypothetical protein